MYPERNLWFSHMAMLPESAIRTTPAEDVFIGLTGVDEDGSIIIRVKVNPLIVWLWIGGAFVLLGTMIAFWPGKGSPSRGDDDGEPIDAVEKIEDGR